MSTSLLEASRTNQRLIYKLLNNPGSNSSSVCFCYSSCLSSTLLIRSNRAALLAMNFRISTKASIILIETSMAMLLFNTEESIATPCSVNTNGKYLRPPFPFEVANCDPKSSHSFSILFRLIESNIYSESVFYFCLQLH